MHLMEVLEDLNDEINYLRTVDKPDQLSLATVNYNTAYAELQKYGVRKAVDGYVAEWLQRNEGVDYKDVAAYESGVYQSIGIECPDGYNCPRAFLAWKAQQN